MMNGAGRAWVASTAVYGIASSVTAVHSDLHTRGLRAVAGMQVAAAAQQQVAKVVAGGGEGQVFRDAR